MSQSNGYWIKGNNIIEITGTTHIDFIIKHPYGFGLTKEYIKKIFKKYNENFNVEGKAREVIIKKISETGWVRARHYLKPRDYWSIQFDVYNKRKKTIRNFIEWAIFDKEIMSQNDEVSLLGYKDNFLKTYSFNSGGIKKFLGEQKVGIKMNYINYSSNDLESFLENLGEGG